MHKPVKRLSLLRGVYFIISIIFVIPNKHGIARNLLGGWRGLHPDGGGGGYTRGGLGFMTPRRMPFVNLSGLKHCFRLLLTRIKMRV